MSLKRNYLLNALVSVVNVAYPLFTLAWVSRSLGPEALGRFYIALSLVMCFVLAAGLGLPMYGAREVAKVRHDRPALERLFSELFLLNCAASLFATSLLAIVVLAVPGFRSQGALFLLLGALVPLNIFAVDFLFLGVEDYANIARRSVAVKALSLALLFPMVRNPGDLWAYAGITVFSAGLYSLWGFVASRSRAPLRRGRIEWRRHLGPLALIGGNVAIVSLYTNLDSVLLGLLTDAGRVGLYNAGIKMGRIIIAILASAGIAVIPRFSHYLSRDRHEEFARAAGKSLQLIYLLTFPAMAFMTAAAPALCRLAFGPAFDGAVPVIRIAAPMIVVVGLTQFIGMQVLFPKGAEKILLVSVAFAGAVAVSLNLLLSPRLGHVGAAWALLAAETTVLLVQWPAFRKLGGKGISLARPAMPYALCCPLAALPFPLLKQAGLEQPWLLPAAFTAGGVLYAGALLAMGNPLARELAALALRLHRPRTSR